MTTPVPGEADLVIRVAGEIDAAFARGYEAGKADERECAFVLVWRDERGEEICQSSPLRSGTRRIGIPPDAQHADLIREDDSDE